MSAIWLWSTRRRHRPATLAVCVLLACLGLGVVAAQSSPAHRHVVAAVAAASNPVAAENRLPGNSSWSIGIGPAAPLNDIDGYTSETSVAPGQTLQLHVTGAKGVRYRVYIYRLGWYGGVGGRRILCSPSCTGDKPVVVRPPIPTPDTQTGYLDVGWPTTDSITIPRSAVSGLYLVKLRVLAGGAHPNEIRNLTFVVREAKPTAPILVQIPVNTEEAYNNWGGRSLYGGKGGAAVEVSFNRPDSFSGTWQLQWGYPLIRFLEKRGYNVGYASDVDTARGIDKPSARRLVIVAGHDEYWSKEMRDQLDAALASGTNFAFMGANTGYWQMRYANNYRSIFEYRSATLDPDPDPATKTVKFRDLVPPRPECQLEGVMDKEGLDTPPSNRAYHVAPGALSNPWFKHTGFTSSTVLKDLVGYEWDTANQPGCPSSQVLFTWSGTNSTNKPSVADAATFTAPSGARVFAGGSFQFSWGLDAYGHPQDASRPLEAFTQNMLDDLSAGTKH